MPFGNLTFGSSTFGAGGPQDIAAPPAPVATVTSVKITPEGVVIPGGTSFKFDIQVFGENNPSQEVTLETTLGSVAADGTVTAPPTGLEDQVGTLTARSVLDPTVFDSVTFAVPGILVDPPEVVIVRTVRCQLGEANGPAANLTGLRVSFSTGTGPHDAGAYLYQSASETTDASGLLTFSLNVEEGAIGASGLLAVLMPDGRHYLGIAAVE